MLLHSFILALPLHRTVMKWLDTRDLNITSGAAENTGKAFLYLCDTLLFPPPQVAEMQGQLLSKMLLPSTNPYCQDCF